MRRAVLIASILLVHACHHCVRCDGIATASSLARFADLDGPPADSGRYPGAIRILSAADPLVKRAAPLRADAEAHERILRRLVRERMPAKSPLEFQFMYVGHDSTNNRMVLRYFARAWDQIELAGWQVQLVYLLPSLHLERAFIQPLPLE